jgi:hypothetical protein
VVRRGHHLVGIGLEDPVDEFAFVRLAGNDRAVLRVGGAFRDIEAEVGFTGFLVGTVAAEAAVGEDRADLAVEARRCRPAGR